MFKKILKSLGVLILVGIAVLGFILVPAHMQIRDINPELPSKEALQALASVRDGPTKSAILRHRASLGRISLLATLPLLSNGQTGKYC